MKSTEKRPYERPTLTEKGRLEKVTATSISNPTPPVVN
jgi:hypothetical protein